MAKRVQEHKEVTKKVQEAKEEYVKQKDKKVSEEAIDTINMVVDVINYLKEKKKEEALQTIEKILGKLELLIAKDPSLQLVPVNVQEQVVDYPGSVEDINKTKKEVIKLIEEGELQKARDIMLNLASELDIYITALPIGTYPVAIKAIVPLIEEEKYDDAIALLIEALETLVLEKIAIPLPLLRAQESIKKANELAKKENVDKRELKDLTQYAKEQLLLAQALGYGKLEEDYKPLFDEIKKIEEKLETNESTKDIFERLKEQLTSLMKGFNVPKEPTSMPKEQNQ